MLAGKLIASGSGPLTNPDTYFHLRFGEKFAGSWQPWHPGHLDRYSSAHWVPTQWLSELGMYGVQHAFGLAGVAVLSTMVITALLASWYASARRGSDPLPALLLTALALVVSSGSLSARPQVASLLLITWTAMAWRRAADSGRVPWLLVPLTWFWALVHGMWILGVITSLALAAGLVASRAQRPRALLVGLGSLSIALLTPVGPRLVSAVLAVNGRRAYIPEWAAPDFTSVTGAVALGLLALTALFLIHSRDASWYEIASLGLSSVFAVYSDRTLPVAVCILLPTLAPRLQAAIGSRVEVSRGERIVATSLCTAVVLAVAVIAPHRATEPPGYTHDFDQELAMLPAATPLLTTWPDGGPLLWTHPELDIPFHGYFDVYTDDDLRTYLAMFALEPGWDRTLRRLGIHDALLPISTPLASALVARGWVVERTASGRELLRGPARRASH
ncbi:hypothetical protein GCM10028801_18980 [Nocardioides maradonensis]